MQLKKGETNDLRNFTKKLKENVKFFQDIYHTGHQNSKWPQNKTVFWCVT